MMLNYPEIIIGTLAVIGGWLIYLTILIKRTWGMVWLTHNAQTQVAIEMVGNIQYLMKVGHFNSVAARHTLNSLRPYVVSLLNDAVEREDYKEAEICKRMIAEMDAVIKKEL